jgi:hypothetical protein
MLFVIQMHLHRRKQGPRSLAIQMRMVNLGIKTIRIEVVVLYEKFKAYMINVNK